MFAFSIVGGGAGALVLMLYSVSMLWIRCSESFRLRSFLKLFLFLSKHSGFLIYNVNALVLECKRKTTMLSSESPCIAAAAGRDWNSGSQPSPACQPWEAAIHNQSRDLDNFSIVGGHRESCWVMFYILIWMLVT